eukprot:scaffold4357_cov113-Isochrysis_galbana.AAC.22
MIGEENGGKTRGGAPVRADSGQNCRSQPDSRRGRLRSRVKSSGESSSPRLLPNLTTPHFTLPWYTTAVPRTRSIAERGG